MAEDRAVASSVKGDVQSGPPIHVALIGGAQLYQAALRHLVQSDSAFQIIFESKSVQDMLQCIRTLRVDVVLLDIDDSSIEAVGLIEQVKSSGGATAILLLANGVESAVTDPLLLTGARGVVSKDSAASHLLSAIRKVHHNELWINRATASRLIMAFADRRRTISPSERRRIDSLSPREREVVAYVADGLSNKAIGKKMGISDNTVRHHLTSIYSKLETRDRLELVIYAFRQGVVRRTA